MSEGVTKDLDKELSKEAKDEASKNSNTSTTTSEPIQLDLIGSRICQVITPVVLCSIYAVLLIRLLEWNVFYKSRSFADKAWFRLGITSHDGPFSITTLVNNIIIVSVFIIALILVTLIILFVLYMEWHSCLSYYFYIPSIIIMSLLTTVYIREVLYSLNYFGLDLITILLFTWNFTALGLVAIFEVFTSAPLYVQQFYLIHNSTLLAVFILTCLPGWTPWLLLGFLVIWDLFAVLAPCGPLNLIIDMAEKVGMVDMPGLVYTTNTKLGNDQTRKTPVNLQTESQTIGNDSKSLKDSDDTSKIGVKKTEVRTSKDSSTNSKVEEESDKNVIKRRSIEEKGVNIGLGDFIFYSLLIGLTAKGRRLNDFYTTLAALVAILVGLVFTLVILVITRRPLPALPISIGLGVFISLLTMYSTPKFMNQLGSQQIFI